VRPEDKVDLRVVPSPLLKRLNLDRQPEGPIVSAGEWVKARVVKNVSKYGKEDVQEIVKGVKTKYYD